MYVAYLLYVGIDERSSAHHLMCVYEIPYLCLNGCLLARRRREVERREGGGEREVERREGRGRVYMEGMWKEREGYGGVCVCERERERDGDQPAA